MQEISITDKEKYLKESYPFSDRPELTDKLKCIHCDRVFLVSDYKVFKDETGDEFICCPYTPDCNGTVIDWIEAN
jgi:hypothetical protein